MPSAPTPDVNAIKTKLADAMNAGPASAAGSASASSAKAASAPSAPPAIGVQTRPNGHQYHPRALGHVEDLAFLRDCRDHGENVILTGEPGTGKSAMAEAAFVMDAVPGVHHGIETLVGTADTTAADFLGTFVQDPDNANAFLWVDGPLTRSVKLGIPFLVDEVALIDPRELSVLYALMDGRGELLIPSNPKLAPIPVPKTWIAIGATNPNVPGAHMSEALLSRFHHHIEVPTDWDLALDLGVPQELVLAVRNLEARKFPEAKAGSSGVMVPAVPTYEGFIPQMRDALAFTVTEDRFGRAFAISGLLRKCPPLDRAAFTAALNTAFGGKFAPLTLGSQTRKDR